MCIVIRLLNILNKEKRCGGKDSYRGVTLTSMVGKVLEFLLLEDGVFEENLPYIS